MRILVVGDDPLNNKLLKVLLELQGQTVFTAEDGMKGLLFLDSSERVDLIISDINMPIMNGFTFLMMVRKHCRYFNVPFIIHSACYTETSHENLALELGATRFLRKSGLTKKIIQTVEELICR